MAMDYQHQTIRSVLQKTLENLENRAAVEECVREMVTDVELAVTLEERVAVEHQMDLYKRQVLEQNSIIAESYALRQMDNDKNLDIAKKFCRELWNTSREIGALLSIKEQHQDLLVRYDELVAKLLHAEYEIEHAKITRIQQQNLQAVSQAVSQAVPQAIPQPAQELIPQLVPQPGQEPVLQPIPEPLQKPASEAVQQHLESKSTTTEIPLPSPGLDELTKQNHRTESPKMINNDADTSKMEQSSSSSFLQKNNHTNINENRQPGGDFVQLNRVENKINHNHDQSHTQPDLSRNTVIPTLDELETSILLHIFMYLDPLDVLSTAQVNIAMYSRVDTLFNAGYGGGGTTVADVEASSTMESSASITAPTKPEEVLAPPSVPTSDTSITPTTTVPTQATMPSMSALVTSNPTLPTATSTVGATVADIPSRDATVVLVPPKTSTVNSEQMLQATSSPLSSTVAFIPPQSATTKSPEVTSVTKSSNMSNVSNTPNKQSSMPKIQQQPLPTVVTLPPPSVVAAPLLAKTAASTSTIIQTNLPAPITTATSSTPAVSGNTRSSTISNSLSSSTSTSLTSQTTTGARSATGGLFSILQPKTRAAATSAVAPGMITPPRSRIGSVDFSASTQQQQQQQQAPFQPLNAAMASSMAAKLSDVELNAIILMTERLKQKEQLAMQYKSERDSLAAKLDGTESVKQFLVEKVRDMEASLNAAFDNEIQLASQMQNDQEVIAFLDAQVQDLQYQIKIIRDEKDRMQKELNVVKKQTQEKAVLMGDMLHFERQKLIESEREWKATKKVLVKEVKHLRMQLENQQQLQQQQ